MNSIHLRHLYFTIIVFIFFALFQLISGIVLFGLKIGMTLQEIIVFYKGDGAYASPLSIESMLEVTYFHGGAMFLTIFIVTHFISFCRVPGKKWLVILLWLSFLVNLGSGYLIRFSSELWVYLKVVGFIGFEFFYIFSIFLILKLAVLELQRRSAVSRSNI